VLIAVWSPKGGSGVTVVATALAILLAREAHGGAVVADLEGDVPMVLGVPEPPAGRGLRQWLAADATVGVDAVARLGVAVPVADGGELRLLPAGGRRPDAPVAGPGRADELVAGLDALGAPVVADCGTLADDAEVALAGSATVSLAVLRPCYLALRRALWAPVRPSGVVLLDEPDRSLGRHDVETVLGVPVRAEIKVRPSVARAVDAGLLASRIPPALARALREAA
jgi:MinD-like ATPase involved in chromosome partitioning or flagellar assembly